MSEENNSEEIFTRTKALIGNDNFNTLKNKHIAIFGLGGVGGYVAEALVRSGIGELTIIDNDTVNITNINRQIIALNSTIGQKKVDLIEKRALDINPEIKINKYDCFFLPENSDNINFSDFDYVIDAVDTVTAKICIIQKAHSLSIPVISSMGTGNKLDPSKFKITTIEKTSVCPLARTMRHELAKRNIKGIKCLYSEENPVVVSKETVTSIAFVPSVAGLLIAAEVIKDLIKI